jgi:hypothetical protein
MTGDPQSGRLFDEALVAFAELVGGFGPDQDGVVLDPEDGPRVAAAAGCLRVERIALDLPVEIEVAVHPGGQLRLGVAPPTQHIATTTMPVLHRLRLRLVRDQDHAE